MAAGFTSPILLGGGQIQPAQKRKRSHEEVPPVGSRAGFCPGCLAAAHRRQQRRRSTAAQEAPPPSSSPQASPPSSPPPPPLPQEGGSQEGLSRLTCLMGRLALESSPRPPSHWSCRARRGEMKTGFDGAHAPEGEQPTNVSGARPRSTAVARHAAGHRECLSALPKTR